MTRSPLLIAALFLGCGTAQYAAGPGEEVLTSPTSEAPDAGVGDQALTSVEGAPTDVAPLYMLAMKFPTAPFPGQKKPPCEPRAEKEVLGVCWSILEARPPCDDFGYEHEGRCLRAAFDAPRHPAAEDPQ